MLMVQPDCAGLIPPGPVSWYGVASPCADSGFAGTMMSQLTLAVVAVAVLVAVVLGHGVADAELVGVAVADAVAEAVLEADAVGVAVPEGAAVGEAVPEADAAGVAVPAADAVGDAVPEADAAGVAGAEADAVGDAVPPVPWWCAALAGTTYAAGEAQLAFAALATLFAPEWLAMATIAPTATTTASGMAIGTAKRASGPLDRRPADRCLLGMQSTSMS